MATRFERPAVRILTIGLLAAGVFGMAAFSWLVVISWDVLRKSLGLPVLGLLVVLAAVAAATWASVLVRKFRRPGHPALTPSGRAAIAALSVVAVLAGIIAVPSTRARLERNKCHRLAAMDAGSHKDCRTWLESRREWWTFGLSHRNPSAD
jgi:drug/metabolite transporter (DMT)-like permease